MASKIDKGNYGEELAVKYLAENGYVIVETKFRCSKGEIDIIAHKGSYLIFIEVKYRKNIRYGLPRESVTKTKQLHIKKVADYYIYTKEITHSDFRFDVIEVLDIDKLKIEHIENAFY